MYASDPNGSPGSFISMKGVMLSLLSGLFTPAMVTSKDEIKEVGFVILQYVSRVVREIKVTTDRVPLSGRGA